MDPLAPTTSTLSPAIAHIAGTAATLQASLKERTKIEDAEKSEDVKAKREQSAREKATVRWVVDAPMRLAERVEKGEKEEAEREWKEIQGLLDKWNGVKGVDDVREECLKVLRGRQ